MKTRIIAFAGICLLVLCVSAFVSIFEIRLASAQVDATSSPSSLTDATTTPLVLQVSTSSTQIEDTASSTPASTSASDSDSATVATSPSSTSTAATTSPPQGLSLVHIVGTKYTDYFTDGTSITAYPGEPAIDSNLDKPNAPIPTHEGLTWDHTDGGYLYDTPSGSLEVGDYAVQPSGRYIENAPPFVSSTSTPAELTTSTPSSTATDTSSTTSNDASPLIPDTSTSTVPSLSDNSSGTSTSSEPTTSPAL